MNEDQKASAPQITFWGGVGTVTGANFLFEVAGKRILVDCGLLQGERFCAEQNFEDFPYDPASIDMLFITHGHMDHIGRVPKLVKDGFRGVIYSTEETKEISAVMLPDGLRILTNEAEKQGLPALYSEEDIDKAMSMWKTLEYHQDFTITDKTNDPTGTGSLRVFLRDAGHILGSCMYEFTYSGGNSGQNNTSKPIKVLFTGDTGNSPSPLLRDTETIKDIDYMVMDSVYGDRNHESLTERRDYLEDVVKKVIARKGTLVIPTFSIERTQVILYELNNLIESGTVPQVPVFVDSPLAIKITEIYRRSKAFFNERTRGQISAGDDIFNFPNLTFTFNKDASNRIDHVKAPKIIIAGSGMSSGGRIIHHERHYLSDPKNIILFVGYQTAGSLGRLILEGVKKVTIEHQEIHVKAEVVSISGYSAHKDSDHLVSFVESSVPTLKKVFCVMGEPKSALYLAQRLRDNFNLDALAPTRGTPYILNQ